MMRLSLLLGVVCLAASANAFAESNSAQTADTVSRRLLGGATVNPDSVANGNSVDAYDLYDAYETEDDETPQQIAEHFNVDVNELLKLNTDNYEGLAADTALLEGTMLLLPKAYEATLLTRRTGNSSNVTTPTSSPTTPPPTIAPSVITQSVGFGANSIPAVYAGSNMETACNNGYGLYLGVYTCATCTPAPTAAPARRLLQSGPSPPVNTNGATVSSTPSPTSTAALPFLAFTATIPGSSSAAAAAATANANALSGDPGALGEKIADAINGDPALASVTPPTVNSAQASPSCTGDCGAAAASSSSSSKNGCDQTCIAAFILLPLMCIFFLTCAILSMAGLCGMGHDAPFDANKEKALSEPTSAVVATRGTDEEVEMAKEEPEEPLTPEEEYRFLFDHFAKGGEAINTREVGEAMIALGAPHDEDVDLEDENWNTEITFDEFAADDVPMDDRPVPHATVTALIDHLGITRTKGH